MYIIAQVIGIFALILAVISFQQKTHKYILAFQLAANFAFVLHFGLLGAYTGAILNAVELFRSIVFVNKGKVWADSRMWLWLFCVLSVVAGIFTWQNALSVLPILGMVCTTVAFWIKTPKYVRMCALPSSPFWLVYNFVNSAWGGVITEVINMASIIIAVIRLDIIGERKCKKQADRMNNIQKI